MKGENEKKESLRFSSLFILDPFIGFIRNLSKAIKIFGEQINKLEIVVSPNLLLGSGKREKKRKGSCSL